MAAAAALGLLVVPFAGARAGDRRAAELRSRFSGTRNASARAIALEGLRSDGSTDARSAMEDLADAQDDRAAVQALAALGRSDHSGARTKLRRVFENTRRSDTVRAAAFLALARLEQRDGSSWTTVASYAASHCRSGSRLAAMVAAAEDAPTGSR